MQKNDLTSTGFRKKVDAPTKENNYGWRGTEGFQKKVESGNVLPQHGKTKGTGSVQAEAKGGPRRLPGQMHELDQTPYTQNPSSYGSSYNSASPTSVRPQTSAPYQPTKLGNISINSVNMDKVSINSSYNGKAQITGVNVISDAEYMSQKSRMTLGDNPDYTARIKVNRVPENMKVRFDSEIGFTEQPISSENINSATQKLSSKGIDVNKLTTTEINSLANGGKLHGRSVTLTSAEQKALKALSHAKENPKSLSGVMFDKTGVGSIRNKATGKKPDFISTASGVDENGRVIGVNKNKPAGKQIGNTKLRIITSEEKAAIGARNSRIKISKEKIAATDALGKGPSVVDKIKKNFKVGNIISGKPTKIVITDGKTVTPGKVIGSKLPKKGPASVFSKYAGRGGVFGKILNTGKTATGGLSKLGNLFGKGFSLGGSSTSTIIVALMAACSIFITPLTAIGSLVLPTNNVEYKNDTIYGGADAPNSTLQQTIDALYFKQKAYEYNLVYADQTTKDPLTGKLYIDEGLPESWHKQIEELKTQKPDNIPDMFDPEDYAAIINVNKNHEDVNAMVTNVYKNGELKGHRLKHFWGPVTCLYPNDVNLETDNETPDAHNDNRITVWAWEEGYDENGVWYRRLVPHTERMQLFCVGGLYGNAGTYHDKKIQHVVHSSEAYRNLKGNKNGPTVNNAGQNPNVINKNITVEYRYKGSKYSYLFTNDKSSYYKTSDGIKVDYSTYEFYRAIVSCAMGYLDNGEENIAFFEDYATSVFDKVMDKATITIEPGYSGGAWFKPDNNPSKRLKWDYIDPVGAKEGMPGKNDYYDNGLSKCSSPSYTCSAKVVITINDAGLQDLMKLDDTTNEKSHAKTFVELIKDFINKLFTRGEKGSLHKFLIDNEDSPFYNTWLDWERDDADERKFSVTPEFSAPEIERNSSQMTYAIMLTDLDKQDFNDFFEGINIPTSSILEDIVEDEDIPISASPIVGDNPVGAIPKPNISEGGIYLDNLCYINQGCVGFAKETRYVRSDGTISTFAASGCLDSSIMMIYYHYYYENAPQVSNAMIYDLWKTHFEPRVPDGTGALETSTVISELGLTASGANYLTTSGWDKAADSLYLGNPVLLHISGHWEYNGEVLHRSDGGHFLIAVGMDDTGVYVYDPGNRRNNLIPYEAWSTGGVSDVYYKTYNATQPTVSDSH